MKTFLFISCGIYAILALLIAIERQRRLFYQRWNEYHCKRAGEYASRYQESRREVFHLLDENDKLKRYRDFAERADEIYAERDRWLSRMLKLEDKLTDIRNTLEGP